MLLTRDSKYSFAYKTLFMLNLLTLRIINFALYKETVIQINTHCQLLRNIIPVTTSGTDLIEAI